jgi:hypothetical protein
VLPTEIRRNEMPDDPSVVCLDSEVPLHPWTVVEDEAIEMRPDNEGRVFEANADPLRWPGR